VCQLRGAGEHASNRDKLLPPLLHPPQHRTGAVRPLVADWGSEGAERSRLPELPSSEARPHFRRPRGGGIHVSHARRCVHRPGPLRPHRGKRGRVVLLVLLPRPPRLQRVGRATRGALRPPSRQLVVEDRRRPTSLFKCDRLGPVAFAPVDDFLSGPADGRPDLAPSLAPPPPAGRSDTVRLWAMRRASRPGGTHAPAQGIATSRRIALGRRE
jgi:hypothetical protein